MWDNVVNIAGAREKRDDFENSQVIAAMISILTMQQQVKDILQECHETVTCDEQIQTLLDQVRNVSEEIIKMTYYIEEKRKKN